MESRTVDTLSERAGKLTSALCGRIIREHYEDIKQKEARGSVQFLGRVGLTFLLSPALWGIDVLLEAIVLLLFVMIAGMNACCDIAGLNAAEERKEE